MGSDPQVVHEALGRVLEQARAWPGARVAGTDEGITQLLLERGVLARFHPDGLVEIPFPRPVGEKLIAAGRAERHHALPDSGWVNTRLEAPEEAPRVIELLKLAYEARRLDTSNAVGVDPRRHTEKIIDQSVEGSFPASDPPAPGRE